MLLNEFLHQNGTYVGLKFDSESRSIIEQYILENRIVNPVSLFDLHVTLLYSRKPLPSFKSETDYLPVSVRPLAPEVWKNGDSRVLVVPLVSPALVERHHYYMKKYEATYDYDVYRPHFTLSYNFTSDIMPKEKIQGVLTLDQEYVEPLND